MARMMVTQWGMSDVGPVAYGSEDQPIFLGKEIARHQDYSEDTARQIDAAVRTIMVTCYEDAKSILTEHRDQLEALTNALVERETLVDSEIRVLLGLPEGSYTHDLRDSEEESGEET
jgi:cell division protease FtsH